MKALIFKRERGIVSRDAVRKAREAMQAGREVDYADMPVAVAHLIRERRYNAEDIRRAFGEARRLEAAEG